MKNNFQNKYLVLGSFMLCFVLVGCGKVSVSGKVTFADGTPLEKGTIRLIGDTGAASGELNPDGTFQIRSPVDGGGIPHGVYKVSIEGAATPGTLIPGSDKKNEYGTYTLPTPLIAKKYESPEDSGIVVDTKKKSFVEIVVDKPE